MKRIYHTSFILFLVIFFFLFLSPKQAEADYMASISATLSTSRPSTSVTLSYTTLAAATTAAVFNDPTAGNQIFLASDSAFFYDLLASARERVTIASMSATNIPASNQRIAYFSTTTSNLHYKGTAFAVPITAMHTVRFTAADPITSDKRIVITYPGSADNSASPSATTFAFNNLASANVKTNGVTCGTLTISSPSITCVPNATITAGTVVTILIGCSGATGAVCDTQAPTLINPARASTAAGTADIWAVQLTMQDASQNDLETNRIKIGTVDSILVHAIVDPIFTMSIAGINTNANYNTSSAACGSETTNSGINATATVVDLGTLGTGITLAGQKITVSTNAKTGYVITATSSGRFIDPGSGYWIPDANTGDGLTANNTPAPATITAGTPAFGISPCGPSVVNSWVGGTAIASGGKLSNPWNSGTNSYYALLASAAGPIANEITVIRYAATVSLVTPSGYYRTAFTYVATPTF